MPITQAELKEILYYDEFTGYFMWLKSKGPRAQAGSRAGSKDKKLNGKTYIRICCNGVIYYAPRLAVLYMEGSFPPEEIDHISGDGTDNRWTNIRKVSGRENSKNARLHSNNTSGCSGVTFHKATQKWLVRIGNNTGGPTNHVGVYPTKEEAIAVRKVAEKEREYHKNHGTNRPL